MAQCTTFTPTPTVLQGYQQSLSRRPIHSSTILIQCSSSIKSLRTLVVCSDGFLSRGPSRVRASPSQDDFHVFILAHSWRHVTPTLCSQVSVYLNAHKFHGCSTSVYSAGAHYKVGSLPENHRYSLTERALLSSRSIWRVQLLHLMILPKLSQPLATCKFRQWIDLVVSSSHSNRLKSICKEFLSKDIPFNEVLSCAYKVGSHFMVWVILIDIRLGGTEDGFSF